MRPRTLFVLIGLIFLAAFALRFGVVRYGWLPTSEEAVLKRARAVTVCYYLGGNYKSLLIDDPAEVQALLAALHVQRDEYYGARPWGIRQPVTIGFHFPGGQRRDHTLETPHQLSGYLVTTAAVVTATSVASLTAASGTRTSTSRRRRVGAVLPRRRTRP